MDPAKAQVTKDELDTFLEAWKEEIARDITKSLSTHDTSLLSKMHAGYKQRSESCETQLEEHMEQLRKFQQQLDEIQQHNKKIEQDQGTLRVQSDDLAATLAAAESAVVTQGDMEAEDFTREP